MPTSKIFMLDCDDPGFEGAVAAIEELEECPACGGGAMLADDQDRPVPVDALLGQWTVVWFYPKAATTG